MKRREFLAYTGLGLAAAATSGCAHVDKAAPQVSREPQTIFFTSAGKTCLINDDGTGFHTLELNAPKQATWQPCGFFDDGRVLMLSMEARRDGPGKPFDKYYHQTPTHIWIHDTVTGALDEIVTKDRLAPFYTPALLLTNDRLLVQVVRDEGGQIFNVALDGSDPHPFTKLGEGLPYGFSLSPDGGCVAFHIASPQGYQVFVSDIWGDSRLCLAADPKYLFFAPQWSPDRKWLLFQGCDYQSDHGHDWSDLWIAREDGSELRRLTEGQQAWFAATYGPADLPGGGSNVPTWTRDGRILFARRTPDAKVPWRYRVGEPDLDHFNREYKPELAQGGTEICRLDPITGATDVLGESTPGLWNFRVSPTENESQIAYCRCMTGESPALWIMNSDGSHQRCLSKGIDGKGADHPRWVPTISHDIACDLPPRRCGVESSQPQVL